MFHNLAATRLQVGGMKAGYIALLAAAPGGLGYTARPGWLRMVHHLELSSGGGVANVAGGS